MFTFLRWQFLRACQRTSSSLLALLQESKQQRASVTGVLLVLGFLLSPVIRTRSKACPQGSSMLSPRLSRALLALLLLPCTHPVWALSDPDPDSAPPVACQTPLTDFRDALQEDEAGITAARMQAAC